MTWKRYTLFSRPRVTSFSPSRATCLQAARASEKQATTSRSSRECMCARTSGVRASAAGLLLKPSKPHRKQHIHCCASIALDSCWTRIACTGLAGSANDHPMKKAKFHLSTASIGFSWNSIWGHLRECKTGQPMWAARTDFPLLRRGFQHHLNPRGHLRRVRVQPVQQQQVLEQQLDGCIHQR